MLSGSFLPQREKISSAILRWKGLSSARHAYFACLEPYGDDFQCLERVISFDRPSPLRGSFTMAFAEVEMSDRVSECAAEAGTRLFKDSDDDLRVIESLERENFELRNEVTRLSLHNATLRRILRVRTPKSQ